MEASPKHSAPLETHVGMRELRQNFRKWMERVRSGECVVVTDRGEPIADLVPHKQAKSWLQQMYERGEIVVGSGELRVGWKKGDPITTAGTDALQEQREERLS